MVVVNIISGRRETNFVTDGELMTNKSGTPHQNNNLSVLIQSSALVQILIFPFSLYLSLFFFFFFFFFLQIS